MAAHCGFAECTLALCNAGAMLEAVDVRETRRRRKRKRNERERERENNQLDGHIINMASPERERERKPARGEVVMLMISVFY